MPSVIWSASDPDANGRITVRERIEGTDMMNTFGPLPPEIVDSFVQARREVISRIATEKGMLRIFNR